MLPFILHTLAHVFMLLPAVLGYNLVFGKGKILHFGQEGLGIVAVYGVYVPFMMYHLPFPLAIGIGAVLTLLTTLLLAWLSLRLDADGLGVMSIAFHLAVLAVALNWRSVTRGAIGIPRISRPELISGQWSFAIATGLVALIWIVGMWSLNRSAFGRALEALAEQPWHAEALGVDRRKMHMAAFGIAGLAAVTGGIFFPMYIHLLSPSDFGFSAMIFLVTIVIAGGPGRFWGPIAATFLLIFLREGLRFVALPPAVLGPVRLLLFGLILFVAVWVRRASIFPPQRKV